MHRKEKVPPCKKGERKDLKLAVRRLVIVIRRPVWLPGPLIQAGSCHVKALFDVAMCKREVVRQIARAVTTPAQFFHETFRTILPRANFAI